jgi:hypothetical protein
MAGALWGSAAARPGVLTPGGVPPAEQGIWPPAGLTLEQKVDLLLATIGQPRYDIIPGDYTLFDFLFYMAGQQEA